MERFIQWLERGEDLGATVDYVPGASMVGTASQAGVTTAPAGGQAASQPVDPAVVQHIGSLQTIHGQLRNIFADMRQRVTAFRSQKMRGAFERELIAGIDGIGRSHAILLPSGDGG